MRFERRRYIYVRDIADFYRSQRTLAHLTLGFLGILRNWPREDLFFFYVGLIYAFGQRLLARNEIFSIRELLALLLPGINHGIIYLEYTMQSPFPKTNLCFSGNVVNLNFWMWLCSSNDDFSWQRIHFLCDKMAYILFQCMTSHNSEYTHKCFLLK